MKQWTPLFFRQTFPFFVCVASTFSRLLYNLTLANNKTNGNNFDGKTLFNMFLFSKTFDSCSARAFLALNNSSFNNFL